MSEPAYRIRRPEVIDERFDDEYVIVNLKTGSYYSLNLNAAVVWDAIGGGATLPEILDYVTALYSDERSDIERHISKILREMQAEALITTDTTPNGNGAHPPLPPNKSAVRGRFATPTLEKYTDMQALLLLDPIHQVDDSGWPSKSDNAH